MIETLSNHCKKSGEENQLKQVSETIKEWLKKKTIWNFKKGVNNQN
jgi:hypothetical protein